MLVREFLQKSELNTNISSTSISINEIPRTRFQHWFVHEICRKIHKKKEIERPGNHETKSNMKQFNTNN